MFQRGSNPHTRHAKPSHDPPRPSPRKPISLSSDDVDKEEDEEEEMRAGRVSKQVNLLPLSSTSSIE